MCTGLDCWLPLKPINKDDMVQGDLLVEVMIDEFTEDMYRGVITVVEARYGRLHLLHFASLSSLTEILLQRT